jgi:hypothetical protein
MKKIENAIERLRAEMILRSLNHMRPVGASSSPPFTPYELHRKGRTKDRRGNGRGGFLRYFWRSLAVERGSLDSSSKDAPLNRPDDCETRSSFTMSRAPYTDSTQSSARRFEARSDTVPRRRMTPSSAETSISLASTSPSRSRR